MTHDTDWLADEYGDLRPEVAEVLNRQQVASAGPSALRRRVRNHHEQSGGGLRVLLLAVLTIAALALYFLFSSRNSEPQPTPRELRTARVIGTNVQVRSGPEPISPMLFRLQHRDQVEVLQVHSPWVSIKSDSGTGWVYGAFLQGADSSWIGPAVVLKDYTVFEPERTSFWTGQKLLVEALSHSGHLWVVLVDGRRVEVPSHFLLLLE